MREHAAVRDYLYSRMRGTTTVGTEAMVAEASPRAANEAEAEFIALLRGIKDDIEGVRRALETGKAGR